MKLLIFLFCLTTSAQEFIPFFSTTTGNNLLPNLVAFWQFEEATTGDTMDSSTNARTLTANAPINVSPSGGIVANCRNFSEFDDNDYFYRNPEGPLSFYTNTAFTISTWVKVFTGSGSLSSDMTLCGLANISTDTNSWWLMIDHATPNDQIRFFYSTNGTATDLLSHSLDWDLGGAIQQNVWYFVCVRWDKVNIHMSVATELDGGITSEVTTPFTSNFYNSTNVTFTVTSINGSTIHDLGGNLDETGIWNIYLSDCQMHKLFLARNHSFTYPNFDSNTCAE